MFHRIISPSNNKSFFIFGARGVGKTTFLREQWGQPHHTINLLLPTQERRYQRNPELLIDDLKALRPSPKWVVIDEIQKVPALLDVIHELIESTSFKFVLTGSSARKLKKSASNLLAGRAFDYRMFPLTQRELGDSFDLETTLNWGSLPSLFSLNPSDRTEYLRAYCNTYLKEEILQEQLVRNGTAFSAFLEVAAQENGKTLNFSRIAKDVGIDTKTAQSFFQILEDTLVGTVVRAYTRSARKSVKLQPKFYLYDLGIKRAMENSLAQTVIPQTSAYGAAFEHFVFLECLRLNHYLKLDYTLSHYQTTAGGEIDLILHRNREVIAVEIKSSRTLDEVRVRKLARVAAPLRPKHVYYVSQDPVSSDLDGVRCRPWQKFLEEVFPA